MAVPVLTKGKRRPNVQPPHFGMEVESLSADTKDTK
jgi:hypothetical protein